MDRRSPSTNYQLKAALTTSVVLNNFSEDSKTVVSCDAKNMRELFVKCLSQYKGDEYLDLSFMWVDDLEIQSKDGVAWKLNN